MITEQIRNFFGRIHLPPAGIQPKGRLWQCSQCHLLFLNKAEGDRHKCQDQRVI